VSRAQAEEGGFTLVEVLVASTIMIVVLGATLGALATFQRSSNDLMTRNQASDLARQAVDLVARDLRNATSPSMQQPTAIARAEAYDVIFQSVDPAGSPSETNTANVRWIRYCLDRSTPTKATLWTMANEAASTPAASPTTTACGPSASGWSTPRAVASDIVNVANGQERPVFAFGPNVANASGTVVGANYNDVREVRISLWVDPDTTRLPRETQLATAVDLRNQNAKPTASFTVTKVGGRRLVLNASMSTDPESEQLSFDWYDGATKIGEGVTMEYAVPGTGTTTAQITLKAYDPAQLSSTAGPQGVTVQ
jgi:type II secretory pathway component PulJ